MQEDRWKYEKVDVNLIDEAEENANRMTDEDFAALCDNIGMSGCSSVPCCYRRANGRFVMISGHHRLRACKKLHYKTIGILYVDESELSRDEIIAIQLSHNSLHGEDDRNILRKMFSQIQSIDFKKFAHINMDEIKTISSEGLNLFAMKENYTVSVILYNNSLDSIVELIGDIREASKKSDIILLADQDPNEELYLSLVRNIGTQYKIKSTNVAFSKILELAAKQMRIEKGGVEDDLGN